MHERESDAASIDELAARINADAARVAALMDERRGAPASCSPSPPLRSSRMWRRSNHGRREVGHTDPTLTLRIYQQLLKRKRREGYRARVNELLGTSPAALSRLPEPAREAEAGPKSGSNSLLGTV
jgi:hypothetical protein